MKNPLGGKTTTRKRKRSCNKKLVTFRITVQNALWKLQLPALKRQHSKRNQNQCRIKLKYLKVRPKYSQQSQQTHETHTLFGVEACNELDSSIFASKQSFCVKTVSYQVMLQRRQGIGNVFNLTSPEVKTKLSISDHLALPINQLLLGWMVTHFNPERKVRGSIPGQVKSTRCWQCLDTTKAFPRNESCCLHAQWRKYEPTNLSHGSA